MVPIHTCMVPTIKTIRELSMKSFASGAIEKKDTASPWWSGTVVSYFLVALLTNVPVEKEPVSNNSQGLTWLSADVQPEGYFCVCCEYTLSLR